MTAKIQHNGNEYDFDAAVNLMDDDIREELHDQRFLPHQHQEFFDAYVSRHREKFGEEFVVN